MGERGKGEETHREEGGAAASLASHPLQEGPGLFHSALAPLLKFQLCAQPSWLTASHVPAPGWAAGSGARGGHMAEKPGNAEQSLDGRLAQGHKCCQYQPGSALSIAWSPQPLAFMNSQGCLQVRRGVGHQGNQGNHMAWLAPAHLPGQQQVIGLTS